MLLEHLFELLICITTWNNNQSTATPKQGKLHLSKKKKDFTDGSEYCVQQKPSPLPMPGRHNRLKVIFLSSNGLAVKCSCNKTQRSAYISSSATLESKVLFYSGSGIKVVFSSGSKTHEIYSSWKSYKYSLERPTVFFGALLAEVVLFRFC